MKTPTRYQSKTKDGSSHRIIREKLRLALLRLRVLREQVKG